MILFDLSRDDKFNYTISIKGVDLITEMCYTEIEAILWGNNFISSWNSAVLVLGFDQLPDKGSKE